MEKKTIVYIVLSLILINLLGSYFYFRWDLTQDKRYSVSNATKNLLYDLDQPVEIEVFLDGNNLPAGFERLKRAVKETLEEFRNHGRGNVSYLFTDHESLSETEKEGLYSFFAANNVVPTTVMDQKGGRKTEVVIFPYAIVRTSEVEELILLLKSNTISSVSAEEKLNQSFENIEYELISSIQRVSGKEKKNVGFIPDFTSSSPLEFRGLIDLVKDNYNLYIIDIQASDSFDGLDVLLLPALDKEVDEETKLKIDQFVMKGGRLLLFTEGLSVDTVGLEGTYAQPLDLKLDDLLFNYGVRVNKDIVKDGLNAAVIPIVVGEMGDEPNIQEMVYRFYPLINNFGPGLITKNIGMVLTKYSSTIDTVNTGDGLTKTPLLLTSTYTRVLNAPALISFNEARTETDEETYNMGEKAVAYLIEGRFKSLYKSNFSGQDILQESVPTRMIVVSDGDAIKNEINAEKGTYYPLGFDKFFKYQYGNQDFLLNALAYLSDDKGLLLSKSKSVAIRPLDELKIRKNRGIIQAANILLPLLVLLIFGSIRYFWVSQKYGRISS